MSILIRPIKEKETKAVWQMFQDIPAKENNTSNHANGIPFEEFDNFCKETVEASKMENLTKRTIPEIMYLMFDNDIPIGFAKLRPFLNEKAQLKRVSQFAYMISPQYRAKGYGKQLFSFLKNESQKIGLSEVKIGSLRENSISRHIIEKNGGILVDDSTEARVIYKIMLEKSR